MIVHNVSSVSLSSDVCQELHFADKRIPTMSTNTNPAASSANPVTPQKHDIKLTARQMRKKAKLEAAAAAAPPMHQTTSTSLVSIAATFDGMPNKTFKFIHLGKDSVTNKEDKEAPCVVALITKGHTERCMTYSHCYRQKDAETQQAFQMLITEAQCHDWCVNMLSDDGISTR